MNITFTKEELAEYADSIANWYNSLTVYVLENYTIDPMTRSVYGGKETFHKLAKKFQEDNPKPNWRTLL